LKNLSISKLGRGLKGEIREGRRDDGLSNTYDGMNANINKYSKRKRKRTEQNRGEKPGGLLGQKLRELYLAMRSNVKKGR